MNSYMKKNNTTVSPGSKKRVQWCPL